MLSWILYQDVLARLKFDKDFGQVICLNFSPNISGETGSGMKSEQEKKRMNFSVLGPLFA
jgi:hypothetical protein